MASGHLVTAVCHSTLFSAPSYMPRSGGKLSVSVRTMDAVAGSDLIKLENTTYAGGLEVLTGVRVINLPKRRIVLERWMYPMTSYA